MFSVTKCDKLGACLFPTFILIMYIIILFATRFVSNEVHICLDHEEFKGAMLKGRVETLMLS